MWVRLCGFRSNFELLFVGCCCEYALYRIFWNITIPSPSIFLMCWNSGSMQQNRSCALPKLSVHKNEQYTHLNTELEREQALPSIVLSIISFSYHILFLLWAYIYLSIYIYIYIPTTKHTRSFLLRIESIWIESAITIEQQYLRWFGFHFLVQNWTTVTVLFLNAGNSR